MKKIAILLVSFLFAFAWGADIFAGERDITIKFMIDGAGSMKEQDIAKITSSILAAEISDFQRNASHQLKESNVRILVDTFWQKGNEFQSQGIFDYRLGQSDAPHYDGLRDFKTRWFVEDETALNKLVNRNWPAENKNTVLVVFSNSQKTLEATEVIEINNDAQKVSSKLLIVELPRRNNYSDTSLKAEIAKRLHSAITDVQKYISSRQFKMNVVAYVNGEKQDINKVITCVAPVEIVLSGEASSNNLYWSYNGKEYSEKELRIAINNSCNFDVTAIGTDLSGQAHTINVKFNILPIPEAKADFIFYPISGVAPLNISFENKSVNAQKYNWNWGDGTPASGEKAPTHTYKNPGEYTVTLTVLGKNGETVETKKKIRVSYPAPVADFSFSKGFVSTADIVSFTNKSSNATEYVWDFGDGSPKETAMTPTHQFKSPGTYTISLQVSNPDGMKSVIRKTIEIQQKLFVDFEFSSTNDGELSFKNKSTGAVKYQWEFGDGEVSEEMSPLHKYAVNETRGFVVKLTAFAANGTKASKEERVTVVIESKKLPPLVADFSANRQANDVKQIFKFTNKSVGAAKYYWDFGDGSKSSEANPTHTYNFSEDRTLNVSLTVVSSDGREEKKISTIKITVPKKQSGIGLVIAIIVLILGGAIFAVFKIMKRGKTFKVTFFSKDNKPMGSKLVKVGEIVSITSLNGANDLDFQIVKSSDDDGDEYKVRFRKPDESAAILKQKALKIHLCDQWGDALDMYNITVDAGRLVISEGDNEEGEE